MKTRPLFTIVWLIAFSGVITTVQLQGSDVVLAEAHAQEVSSCKTRGHATRGKALLIGNSAYKHISKLNNPGRDVEALGEEFFSKGFEVTLCKDVERSEMVKVINAFTRRVKPSENTIVMFSGHGMEIGGDNYLLPIEIEVNEETNKDSLISQAYSLSLLQNSMSELKKSGQPIRLLILDACRNDPFKGRGIKGQSTRGFVSPSTSSGLAIWLATSPGMVALDRDSEVREHSPFVVSLLKHLRSPEQCTQNLSVLNSRVENMTAVRTNRAQQPWMTMSGMSEAFSMFSFCSSATQKSSTPTAPPSKSSSTITKFSLGDYALIPAGSFMMGSANVEAFGSGGPVRQVFIKRDFYMKTSEVTQGEWIEIMGNNPSDCKYGCGHKNPVQNMSWNDILIFLNKLSERENIEKCYVDEGGKWSWPKGPACLGYRLPTEAEWEYAARSGASDEHLANLDNISWYFDNSEKKTHVVAGKQANNYGLYDMLGNVWEWTWDVYTEKGSSWQSDPIGGGLVQDTAGRGVIRGCGWTDGGWRCKITFRGHALRSEGGGDLGLRPVRSKSAKIAKTNN